MAGKPPYSPSVSPSVTAESVTYHRAAPEWPAVGDVVVEWNHSTGSRKVVTKITATQVVCTAHGRETRFRLKGLSRIGAGSWNGSTLIREDDPRFLKYEAQARRSNIAAQVEALMVRFRRDQDEAAALEAHDLLAKYLAHAKASSTAGSEDYPSSAPNGENAGYRKGSGGHDE